jgi:purine-binding chemotaxis protein CheW
LRKRFGLTAKDPTRETRMVVAGINGNKVGLIVDSVTEVRRIAEAAIEPPSPLVTSVDSTYIVGIAKDAEQLIVLLDLEHVLSVGGLR